MWRRSAGGGNSEQFLEKAAELAGAIYEMDLQDPVARIALGVRLPQQLGIAGTDGKALGVGGQALVGEMPDEVTRHGRTELPPRRGRKARDIVIQLPGREVGRLLVQLL